MVRETVAALDGGTAAVVVVTKEFEGLAKIVAQHTGRPGMRTLVLPYPLVTLPETEIREIAHEHFGRLLDAIR